MWFTTEVVVVVVNLSSVVVTCPKDTLADIASLRGLVRDPTPSDVKADGRHPDSIGGRWAFIGFPVGSTPPVTGLIVWAGNEAIAGLVRHYRWYSTPSPSSQINSKMASSANYRYCP